ncbi:MAG: hypothetical protein ACI8SE_000908, partial [Bacteroidia bacterium]
SGYGNIFRYQLSDSFQNTVVIKCITLNQSNAHPRGRNTDHAHNRKVKSYEVETHWYEKWNHCCNNHCRVPKFIGSFTEGIEQWIILEDLDVHFPLRKQQLDLSEVKVCLEWLANFHAIFLNKKPTGLWDVGTYWHLETRPDEFEKIEHQKLKSKAPIIDAKLNQSKYQTIVHGDAKLANFCFSGNSKSVAAVDFQYVGGGCGIKDVAYFLGSCLSSNVSESHQNELLDFYFSALQKAFDPSKFYFSFEELEEEWRQLYPIACVDFTRFLFGWMPSHQKTNNYQLNLMKSVLASL